MGKKYFFFHGCNFKKDEEDDMGRGRRNRNHNRNKNKQKETRPRFAPQLDEDDTDVFGFAEGIIGDDDSGRWGWKGSSSYSSSFSSSNEKKQTAQNQNNVISTSKGFFEIHHSDAWGSALIPVEDPKAINVTAEDIEGIKLIDNFPKIPAHLWSRWIKLCLYQCYDTRPEEKPVAFRGWCSETKDFEFYTYKDGKKTKVNAAEVTGPNAKYTQDSNRTYYTNHKQLEVSVLLCRKADDLTKWKIFVPKQQVTHASVSAETQRCVDIETGEIHNVFPPAGWLHAGSSHSHNTMGAFFSSTDDGSELSVPGLHIVVGSIDRDKRTYDALASIVLRQCRKKIDVKTVVEEEHIEDANFHSNVLECISNKTYGTVTTTSSEASKFCYGEDHPTSASERWPISQLVEKKEDPVVAKDSEKEDPAGVDTHSEGWWARWKAKFLSSYKPFNANRPLPKGPPAQTGCSLQPIPQPDDYSEYGAL